MKKSWRDVLPIHPAADLFPLMSEPELRELGEDIKKNGLRVTLVLWRDDHKKLSLLDGRNRLDAMELVGVPFGVKLKKGEFSLTGPALNGVPLVDVSGNKNSDPYEFVLSANAHRRHLTAEQKRELIAKLLKAKPEASNNAVAKQVKADDKTVAKVRRELEATSEIPKLEKTVGADGKARKQPAKRRAVTHPVSGDPAGAEHTLVKGEPARRERIRRAEVMKQKKQREDYHAYMDEKISGFAYKLIQLDAGLARDLRDIIAEGGDPHQLMDDLATGMELEKHGELNVETPAAAIETPPNDDGLDPPEFLRRYPAAVS